MTQIYNRTSEKAKRQQLRRNMTKAELWQKLSVIAASQSHSTNHLH
ncbi:hypothetical protein [Allocoleopsis franciscana]|nr:hypothetical protein [Allocoleopsis franciscana]